MSTNREDFGIVIRSALLKKGARQKFSLFFLISISIAIFVFDSYSSKFMGITRSLINDLIYKISSVATSPIKFTSIVGSKTTNLIFVFKENKDLKKELEFLKLNKLKTEFLITQNKEIDKKLKTNISTGEKSVPAKVLLDKDSPYLKSIIINQGSKVGIKKGMPVLDSNYMVGRIVEVNFLSARVLLLNDLNSRIPVVISESAAQAILTGKGSREPELEYLPEQFEFANNLAVFTSGKDGIFKQGIPIGKTFLEDNKLKVKLFSDPHQLSFVNIRLINIEKD